MKFDVTQAEIDNATTYWTKALRVALQNPNIGPSNAIPQALVNIQALRNMEPSDTLNPDTGLLPWEKTGPPSAVKTDAA